MKNERGITERESIERGNMQKGGKMKKKTKNREVDKMVRENFLKAWYRKCIKICPSDIETCIILDGCMTRYCDSLSHRK